MNSMTGFGKCTLTEDDFKIDAEVKTVNHRFLDVSVRGARELDMFEPAIRETIKTYFGRGHVEVRIEVADGGPSSVEPHVDHALLEAYLEAAKTIAHDTGVQFDVNLHTLMKIPDLVSYRVTDDRIRQVRGPLLKAVAEACEKACGARSREGALLWKDIEARSETLADLVTVIADREPIVVEEYRTRLASRIEELMPEGVPADPARIAQEVALFADRLNVTEEITRIRAHLEHLRELGGMSGPQGRSMDFLVQELNREFNTIASKSQDAALTRCVLDGKAEVEKIREQIQNIE